MCGLADFVTKSDNHTSNVNVLERMSYSINHRGPDDFGQFYYKKPSN